MLTNPSLAIVVVHDSKGPYGTLTQAQARAVEKDFQDQLTAIFPSTLRDSWTNLNSSTFNGMLIKDLAKNDESLASGTVAAAVNQLLGAVTVGGEALTVKSDYWMTERRCRIKDDTHTDGLSFQLFQGLKRWSLSAIVDGITIWSTMHAELEFDVRSFA